jgi:hypothetical protein
VAGVVGGLQLMAPRERLAAWVEMVARGKSCATSPDEPVGLPAFEIGEGK